MKPQLEAALNDTSRPTLAEFYADWCPHCQRMMPVIAKLRQELRDSAHIVQIEGERDQDLMEKYHVRSFPTWIIFEDGQEAWRDSGEKPLSELKDMLERFI